MPHVPDKFPYIWLPCLRLPPLMRMLTRHQATRGNLYSGLCMVLSIARQCKTVLLCLVAVVLALEGSHINPSHSSCIFKVLSGVLGFRNAPLMYENVIFGSQPWCLFRSFVVPVHTLNFHLSGEYETQCLLLVLSMFCSILRLRFLPWVSQAVVPYHYQQAQNCGDHTDVLMKYEMIQVYSVSTELEASDYSYRITTLRSPRYFSPYMNRVKSPFLNVFLQKAQKSSSHFT